jgi:WD40 repeat protein
MFFFNGLTGEQDGEPIKCSEGTIMGVSWSGDGGRVVTCSADRSVKICKSAKGLEMGSQGGGY